MAGNTHAIFVAGPGGVFLGDVGVAEPPTNATDDPLTDLSGWKTGGKTAKDPGVSITPTKTAKDVESWEDFDPVRTIIQGRITTIAIQFLEVNKESLNLALDGVTVSGSVPDFAITLNDPSQHVESALIVDGLDDERKIRMYFPRVVVDTTAEIPFKRTNETQLILTMKVLKPASGASIQPFIHDPDDEGGWSAS